MCVPRECRLAGLIRQLIPDGQVHRATVHSWRADVARPEHARLHQPPRVFVCDGAQALGRIREALDPMAAAWAAQVAAPIDQRRDQCGAAAVEDLGARWIG